jgi:hypothetical protein
VKVLVFDNNGNRAIMVVGKGVARNFFYPGLEYKYV